jgi:hypothetical protein
MFQAEAEHLAADTTEVIPVCHLHREWIAGFQVVLVETA